MWFYEKWLARANAGVLVSVLGLLLTVALAYPLAAQIANRGSDTRPHGNVNLRSRGENCVCRPLGVPQ